MITEYLTKFKKQIIWLSDLSNSWNIAQKISYGYSVVIGISFLGTISGLLLASNNEVYAYKQLNLSYQHQSLLKNLENSVTRIRLHPQRLATVLENSIWFEFEKNQFNNQLIQVNEQLADIEIFVHKYADDLLISKTQFDSLLESYRVTTQVYSHSVKSFWEQVEQNNFSEEKAKSHHTDLINLLQEREQVNINVKFDQLSDELIRAIGYADIQQQKADTRFEEAQKLRVKVIFASMLLSGAIAAALAIYTSRLIARPLELVTKVARRITQESNFQLRININSHDEVGTLATSLNQLVEWVADYTQEIEIARHNLEQRVEERTQELELARHNLEQRVEERTQELQKILQDLKETQAQLIQTEKMSSLGEMVAGIAHEVNNPVNFINGNIQCANDYIQDLLSLIDLYQQEYPEPSEIIAEKTAEIDLDFLTTDLSSLLSSMKMGAQRIREIVLSLRNFSRLDEAPMKEVNIHEGLDNTLLILNHRLNQSIAVIKNYGILPLIECYPAQLNQVFMNILSNAIDVLMEEKTKAEKQITIDTLKLDDHYIKVVIKDNASGIAPEIINKLFNPFFTTKPVGKGTGLGLSISYQIIDKHKGKIEVISELGKGTEFIILLPIKTQLN
ncbi:sensor histidine kinase [Nodularia sphaerocarpa]|uniref:sensor histidine kinase n=1 Tax=Nodularia sphaerocarpa TaxID=137816 RepID=UPI001EFA9776|nr:ATP-binding protein [Nodularia sphaerocarpa]MDB9372111.1 ATP-binding protein [Nodularia sphaerocarpa CS-585]MDB9379568.1 ATP-binding protein [Nodularia sphaerocarpa CS-585A2]ULP70412.1 Signal transduction histidine-protein kinase AtoS [Nodularia sphaerocarpa UHCC 0038]